MDQEDSTDSTSFDPNEIVGLTLVVLVIVDVLMLAMAAEHDQGWTTLATLVVRQLPVLVTMGLVLFVYQELSYRLTRIERGLGVRPSGRRVGGETGGRVSLGAAGH